MTRDTGTVGSEDGDRCFLPASTLLGHLEVDRV